jgi:glycosyltransferase involved in cell wall biosynthesis
MTEKAPFFTVVVPTYNRAELVRRAIDSCLIQRDADFEVVVVDDASTDTTEATIRSYSDPRLRFARHPSNRGVCAARNSGVELARGAWCVMLDSDDELLPGALRGLATHCLEQPDDVGNVASGCSRDSGPDSPVPFPSTNLLLDYRDYLHFIAGLRMSDWFNCIRRTVFDRILYPSGRAYEGSFHLALAARYRFRFVRERFVKVHSDAEDRITAASPRSAIKRMLREAADSALDAEDVLAEHGDAFRKEAPSLLTEYARGAVVNHLLAGQRQRAIALMAAYPELGRSPSFLALAGAGLCGPGVLAGAKAVWGELRRFRNAVRRSRFSSTRDARSQP